MTLKTAVVAPMPNVREVMAVRASPGFLHNSRQEYRRSCSTLSNTGRVPKGYLYCYAGQLVFRVSIPSRDRKEALSKNRASDPLHQ